MEPLSRERTGGDTDIETAPARTIVEVGPYDFPTPPGGWVDLDLGEEGGAAGLGDREPTVRAPHSAMAVRRAPITPIPGGGSTVVRPPDGARSRAAGAVRRWLLFPEALVVAGFVLLGILFALGLRLSRSPAPPAGRDAPAALPVAGIGAPSLVPAHRGTEDRELPPAEGAAEGSPPPTPAPADAAVQPEAPPAPDLAPWDGAG